MPGALEKAIKAGPGVKKRRCGQEGVARRRSPNRGRPRPPAPPSSSHPLPSQLTLTKRTPDPSGTVLLTARGPGWAASHHTGTKDSAVSLTKGVAGGALTLRQSLPGGKLFLFPSPAATWVKRVQHGSGDGLGGADVIALEADALRRTVGASQTWYSGKGLKAGLGLLASTASGDKTITLAARQKLKGAGPLHSVGGVYSSASGPELNAKVRPGKGVFGRVAFWPRTGVAAVSAFASPAWLTRAVGGEGAEGARKGTLTLDARVPVTGGTGGDGGKVKGVDGLLGLKWRF